MLPSLLPKASRESLWMKIIFKKLITQQEYTHRKIVFVHANARTLAQ